jgi:hypothetical protein
VGVTGAQSCHTGIGQVDEQAAAPPGCVDLQVPAVMLPGGANMGAYRRPTGDGEDCMPVDGSVLAGPGERRAQGIADADGGGIDEVPILDPPWIPDRSTCCARA